MKVLGWIACVSAAALLPSPAAAVDLAPHGPALRGGISLSPDQFHGGLHVEIGRSALRFRPTAELGAGNGVLLAAFGGDIVYHLGRSGWVPYVGAGPGLNLIDVTDGVGEAGGLEARLVGNALAGLTRAGSRYFLEARAGLGNTPDLKLSVGFGF